MTSSTNVVVTSLETIQKIDNQIFRSNATICRHIENLDILGRGAVSQDILQNLRTFVEHIMYKIYAESNYTIYDYSNLVKAISYVRTKGQLKFIWKFHSYLQIVVSHQTLEPEDSERVMLKYYEFLLRIKTFLEMTYGFEVLSNLDKFPLDTDKNLYEYYERISEKLQNRVFAKDKAVSINGRYYIHKIRPFFIRQNIFYEVTFLPTIDKSSKFDRIIAFTRIEILDYYAVRLWTVEDKVEILGRAMPIHVIIDWEVSIRPIEIERFSNILGKSIRNYHNSAEARGLMYYLKINGFNLVELISFGDVDYLDTRSAILEIFGAKTSHLFDLLDECRDIITSDRPGSNVLRYLLFHMNNRIMSDQIGNINPKLSNLYLNFGCKPFDAIPFNTSLLGHNPRVSDLFECIDSSCRIHELLARYIRINTEQNGMLYTPRSELESFGDVDVLVESYNSKLYNNTRHQARRIKERNSHFYIHNCEDNTVNIINILTTLSHNGVQNYTDYVDDWLSTGTHKVDSDEKREFLRNMFSQSHVALIYGSAGTGKSYLINHISTLFNDQSKLYLANTNPAVDNLKRRVITHSKDTDFITITKFVQRRGVRTDYDILFIDECSTVSNEDMISILRKAKYKLLVMAGDVFQIQSIQFGNWFSAVRDFLPTSSVFELRSPYRSTNHELQILWDRVRIMDDTVVESLVRNNYTITLDSSIFETTEQDEIILCLNYDGLYGINSINRLLQEANSNPVKQWGLLQFKIGDPVLFNDSNRFYPLIYNNLKGWLKDIQFVEDRIQFDIEVDKVINGLEAQFYDFELLPSSKPTHSIIRFCVDDYRLIDDNREVPITAIIPFQVAYAVSIHKAQGLEFNSVKIVITDEIEEHITHSVFYTAITRAREKLKIYWTPEVGQRILSSIRPKVNTKDIVFLRQVIDGH